MLSLGLKLISTVCFCLLVWACYTCMPKNGFLLCCGLLVSMCASFTYANVLLLTKKSLLGWLYVPSFLVCYMYAKVLLSKPLR